VRHFVVPCLHALKYDPDGSLTTLRDVDFEKRRTMRPAKGYKYPEAGLVASALKSFGLMTNHRDHILRACLPSAWDRKGRVKAALELGLDPKKIAEALGVAGDEVVTEFNVENTFDHYTVSPRAAEVNAAWVVRHSFAKNAFRALARRARGRTLILPGRDVWVFEIHARRAGYPSIYDPRVSRTVACDRALLRRVVETWRVVDFDRAFVFDTGFAGSIARALRDVVGPNLKDVMLSTSRRWWNPQRACTESLQLFPNHTGSRGKALDIEYTPKYFRTGTVKDARAEQYLAHLDEFIRAAAMTIWWCKVKSPRFIRAKKKSTPQAVLDSAPTLKISENTWQWGSITQPTATVDTGGTTSQYISVDPQYISVDPGTTASTLPFTTWATIDTAGSDSSVTWHSNTLKNT
jgi:hypothetical protein